MGCGMSEMGGRLTCYIVDGDFLLGSCHCCWWMRNLEVIMATCRLIVGGRVV